MLYLRKTCMRLALKLFRGEPAISGFDWNFSPIHTSSPPFSTDVGSDLHCLTATSSWTWIVTFGFRSTPTSTLRPIQTWFPSAPSPGLNSPASVTRRTVLKSTVPHFKVVPQLVNIWFQVLFFLLPGSFSPFLHSTMRYRSLRSI